MKLQMLQVQMGIVYKVQNMQLIEDNIIHQAVSEEEEEEEDEAEDDLHSVLEEDFSVVCWSLYGWKLFLQTFFRSRRFWPRLQSTIR